MYEEHPDLHLWVCRQRDNFHKEKLSPEHLEQLNSLGNFDFTGPRRYQYSKEEVWHAYFKKLEAFQQEHGHCGTIDKFPEDNVVKNSVGASHDSITTIGFFFGPNNKQNSWRPFASLNRRVVDLHVGAIENDNKVVKERVRSGAHRLPCRAMPGIVIKHMVADPTDRLNFWPVKGGMSKCCSAIVAQHCHARVLSHLVTMTVTALLDCQLVG